MASMYGLNPWVEQIALANRILVWQWGALAGYSRSWSEVGHLFPRSVALSRMTLSLDQKSWLLAGGYL